MAGEEELGAIVQPSMQEGLIDGLADQRPVERAYEIIRRAILLGTLKPGDHLSEEMLASMTGTSRTPVREALRRLAAEGLATVQNRHRFVSKFSFDEVIIIFDLRARLEGYAARIAAQKISATELAKLARLIDEIDELKTDGSEESLERFVSLNADFHYAVAEATRSNHMRQLMAPQMSLPLALFKQFIVNRGVNIKRSNDQHRDILSALTQHNPDWAEAAMTGHILSTKPAPIDDRTKPKRG